jgi:hypothetical protein
MILISIDNNTDNMLMVIVISISNNTDNMLNSKELADLIKTWVKPNRVQLLALGTTSCKFPLCKLSML